MKKIIPFKKEIIFKTNISEITSISLEHQLSIDNLNVTGEFVISGDYKVSDKSITVESFNYNIPFDTILESNYNTENASVDIDDFYYEIVNDKVLLISIDICIDKLNEVLIPDEIPNIEEKKDIIEELFEEQNQNDLSNNVINYEENNILQKNDTDNRCIDEDDILPGSEEIDKMDTKMEEEVKLNKENKSHDINDKINSIFSNVGDGDIYVSYNVYIIREGDTVESIISKYETTEEELKKYNNLTDLKLGDKLIIPAK